MVLTIQQQSDVKDIIMKMFNDKDLLSTLAETVANLVFAELNDKWNSLQERNDILESRVTELEQENAVIRKQLNSIDQFTRRRSLRLLGLKEQKDEDLTSLVQQTLCSKLSLQQDEVNIENCYRLKTGTAESNDNRPIIVSFSSLRSRELVFRSKRKMKGTQLIITENLTSQNYNLLKLGASRLGFREVWTSNGNVYAKNGTMKKRIRCEADLEDLIGAGEQVPSTVVHTGRYKRRAQR